MQILINIQSIRGASPIYAVLQIVRSSPVVTVLLPLQGTIDASDECPSREDIAGRLAGHRILHSPELSQLNDPGQPCDSRSSLTK